MKFKNVLIVLLSAGILALGGMYLHTLNQLVDVKTEIAGLTANLDSLTQLSQEIADQSNANSKVYSDIMGLVPQEEAAADDAETAADDDADPVTDNAAQPVEDAAEPVGDDAEPIGDAAEPVEDVPVIDGDKSKEKDLVGPRVPDDSIKEDGEEKQSGDSSQDGSLSASRGKNSAFQNTAPAPLLNYINQQLDTLNSQNGNWAVYAASVDRRAEVSVNSQKMQAASLIKLFIMGCVYDNYDSLSQAYGQEALDENLRSMITVSDNDAANELVTWLGSGDAQAGMDLVNDYCQAHEFQDTHMGRLLLASNETDDNYTSVKDCGSFLASVYNEDSAFTHTQDMLSLLSDQERTNKIPSGLPEVGDIKCANKTGELDTVENDAAIVYQTPRQDFILCIMSQNLQDTSAARDSIIQMSRDIYGYFNETPQSNP